MGIKDKDYHVGGERNEYGERTSRIGEFERDLGGPPAATKERERKPFNKELPKGRGCGCITAIGLTVVATGYFGYRLIDYLL